MMHTLGSESDVYIFFLWAVIILMSLSLLTLDFYNDSKELRKNQQTQKSILFMSKTLTPEHEALMLNSDRSDAC